MLCVWVRGSHLSCASALALFCRPCFGWSVASVLPVWFSFRGAPRAPFLPCLVLPASLPFVLFGSLPFLLVWRFLVFVWCLFVFLVSFFCCVLFLLASPHVSLLRWLRMAKDCRPQQYTHPRQLDLPPLSSSGWGLVLPFFRLFGVSARLFCCLVPLALTSYSVREVGCSRPEPWTRLHCSESHLREPVVLSAGQSGAPVKQSLRTWIVSFFFGSAVTQLAHSSGEWRLLWISRLTHCFWYVAMHCRYFAETHKDTWPPMSSSSCHCFACWYLLLDWIWAREQVLVRGLWEAGLGDNYSNCDF